MKKTVAIILAFSFQLLYGAVYVNQCGYLPVSEKFAYSNEAADSFFVVNKSTQQVMFKEALTFRVSDDPSTGLSLYEADFSSFQTAGHYFIRISSGSESVPFIIADTAFSAAVKMSLKGLYFQRCGTALDREFAGLYDHESCHSADGIFHSSTDSSGYMSTRGGWHDAGDYGKYVVPACNAAGTLLMLYEKYPLYISMDDLNIPESGNGIADILDETRYELEWLLSMQKNDGGVYFKVTTKNFVGWIMPEDNMDIRYIYETSSTATADLAAVMAAAYRVYQSIDADFAQTCLTAAQKSWQWLEAHPNIVPEGGFQNPEDTETGEYGDDDDSDERLWAAAELFEATGETAYNQYFQNHYQDNGIINGPADWQDERSMAQLCYLTGSQPAALQNVKNNIRQSLYNYCDDQNSLSNSDGFRVAMEGWEYYWGSNSVVMDKAILLIYAYEESNNDNYLATALHQLNYILGSNAHNMTFVSGLATNYPHNIHHAPSASDDVEEPVPGLMAGGPDKYLDDPELQAAFNSNTPPALCYLDVLGSYASNEITVYWNASLIFVSAYFNKGSNSTSVLKPDPALPKKMRLHQNYPNPFGASRTFLGNPKTRIEYELDHQCHVKLSVYNLLGQEVKTLVSGMQGAGEYAVDFDGSNLAGGLYFYKLQAGNFSQIRKMFLIR